MRTPLHAMLWELWRTSRTELICRISALAAFAALVCTFASERLDEIQVQVVQGIALIVLTAGSTFSAIWLSELETKQHGFSFRLGFTRPISTTQLVVVPMLFAIVVAVVSYLLPALVVRTFLKTPVPLLGPGAVVGCTVACFVAAAWSTTTIVGKGVGLATLAVTLVVSLLVFHAGRGGADPILLAMGRPGYFDLAWYHYVGLVILASCAVFVTVVAVDKQRHGDQWQPGGLGRWRRSQGISTSRGAPRFGSPVVAQCWYETRRFGTTVLLLSVIAPLVVFVVVSILPWVDSAWDSAPFAWLVALGLCPFVYQLVGADGALGLRKKQGTFQFSAFDATRPMSNDQLIAIKLLVIATCSLAGWLLMGAAAALHAAMAGDWHVWQEIGAAVFSAAGNVPAYWWIAGISNTALLVISTTSVLLAFGLWLPLHPKIFVCGAMALYAHLALAVWDANHEWTLWYFWTVIGYLFSVVTVVACVVALRKALAAGFLGKRLFGGACCLWSIYVASTLALYIRLAPTDSLPTVAIVLGASMLLVPLATTAIAPLALASHRHG